MSESATTELKKGALRAAREARREVAALMHEVADPHPELGKTLSGVVATLFSAEVGDAPKIHLSLLRASDVLGGILDEEPFKDEERVSKVISRALALMHPAKKALGRQLGLEQPREDSTAPFLLTTERSKGATPGGGDLAEEERRRALRAELDVEVGLEGDNRFYTGKTGDISAGGLFVGTDTPLMVGTELILSFVLPDGYRVATEATVAWVRAPRYRPGEMPSGMGVRFENLDSKDERALTHFLEQRPAFHYGD